MTYNNSIDSELKILNILVAVFIHQDEDPENLNQDSGGEIIELKCTPFLDQKTKKPLKTSKCPVARRKCQTTTKNCRNGRGMALLPPSVSKYV